MNRMSLSLVTPLAAVRPAVPRISVVVPAMNEARNLEVLLPELVASMSADGLICHEVILVDGGSRDDTVATARGVLAVGAGGAPDPQGQGQGQRPGDGVRPRHR